MASTNQQELSHLPVVAHNMANQRQQQQELIKLLAQHFHHQFYQLASTTSNGSQQQQQHLAQTSSTASSQQHQVQNTPLQNHHHHHQQQQQQTANAFQRSGQQHFQVSPAANDETAALNAASLLQSGARFDTNLSTQQCASMNLTTNLRSQILNNVTTSTNTNNNNNTNHTSRSQEQPTDTGTNLTIATESHHLMDFTTNGVSSGIQQNNLANFYTLNELNLFNALGLNLTNNQLVLSLQQQSLIQAAAAARQYELTRGMTEEEDQQQVELEHDRNIQRHIDLRGEDGADVNDGDEVDDVTINLTEQADNIHSSTETARKEMLKFSINTILGRGSPQLACAPGGGTSSIGDVGGLCKRANFGKQQQQQQEKQELKCANEHESRKKNSKIQKISEERKGQKLMLNAVDVECDHLETGSDSSSISATTPNPPTSSSLIFNQNTSMHLGSEHQHLHTHQHHQSSTNPLVSLQGNGSISLAQQHSLRNHHHHQHAHNTQTMQFLPGSAAFPWTVAARGKPRRGMMRRAVFSDSQRVGLEKRFQLQKYISKPDRKKLAEKLGLRDSQVKIWFQNRRMKWRNSKERELLSAGGSREQTLPTRNNPNPDLSDVGETVKRLASTNNNDTSVGSLPTSNNK